MGHPLKPIPNLRPLYHDQDGSLLLYRNGQLLKSSDGGETLVPMARFPRGSVLGFLEGFSLSRRLLRLGCHEWIRLEDGAYLGSVRGQLVRLEAGASDVRPVFTLPRGSRPLRLCSVPGGWIYFGEYFPNPQREPVHIYGSCDGGLSWKTVYRFEAGQIRHIHGVFYDPYRKGCWVLTGDDDAECRILFSKDQFGSVETLASGSQSVRSVYLIPKPEGIVTATDTPFEQNYIHWMDPATGQMRRVQAVEGSVLYGTTTLDYLVLSTIVEPSLVNLSREACIWLSKDGTQWKRLVAVPQDRFAGRLFQYGAFHFPRGQNRSNHLFAYSQALRPGSGLLSWDLDRQWAAL